MVVYEYASCWAERMNKHIDKLSWLMVVDSFRRGKSIATTLTIAERAGYRTPTSQKFQSLKPSVCLALKGASI